MEKTEVRSQAETEVVRGSVAGVETNELGWRQYWISTPLYILLMINAVSINNIIRNFC